MRTVEQIKEEISKIEKAQRNADRKIARCVERLVELRLELSEAEKKK